eukprot:m.161638 g.161638  ORF g.161638 m.161638 type:complete len:1374 (-) comp13402_c0_seq7:1641-5762(-)
MERENVNLWFVQSCMSPTLYFGVKVTVCTFQQTHTVAATLSINTAHVGTTVFITTWTDGILETSLNSLTLQEELCEGWKTLPASLNGRSFEMATTALSFQTSHVVLAMSQHAQVILSVFNNDTSSGLVDDYDCGCSDHTVFSSDPIPHCERKDDYCEFLRFSFESYIGYSEFFGFYKLVAFDTYNYPYYVQSQSPNHVLFFDMNARAWKILDEDNNKPVIQCHAANLVNATHPNLVDCQWFIVAENGQQYFRRGQNPFECADCTQQKKDMCAAQNKICVVGSCMCPLNTVGDSCTPIASLCTAVEFSFPNKPQLSGVYYIQEGIKNGRPAYISTRDDVGEAFTMEYAQTRWIVSNKKGTVLAQRSSDVLEPFMIDEGRLWQVKVGSTLFFADAGVAGNCSSCTKTTCPEPSHQCRAETVSSTSVGGLARLLVSSDTICTCSQGMQMSANGGCIAMDECAVIITVDNSTVLGRLNPEETQSIRPLYRGNLAIGSTSKEHILSYSLDFSTWMLYRNDDGTAVERATFLSTALTAQDAGMAGFEVKADFRGSIAVALGGFKSIGVKCTPCNTVTCPKTQVCVEETPFQGTCRCESGFTLFNVDGVDVCHVPQFAEAPQELLVSYSTGQVIGFELVSNDVINDYFYYVSFDDRRRASTYIFFSLPSGGRTGGWAIGDPADLSTILNSITDAPLPSDAEFSGLTIEVLCTHISFTAVKSGINRITLLFDEVVTDANAVVFVSTTASFESVTEKKVTMYTKSTVIDDLLADDTYYFKAAIVVDECRPYPIVVRQVNLPTALPVAAPSVSFSSVTSTSLTMTFGMISALEANGDIVGYMVEYQVQGDSSSRRTAFHPTRMFTLLDLHPAYVYVIRVGAQTSAGLGPFSEAKTVQTLDGVPDEGVFDELFVDTSSQLVAVVLVPSENERNGMLQGIRFHCTESVAGDAFVVSSPVHTNNNTYVLWANVEVGATFQCNATFWTSAGFGDSAVSSVVTHTTNNSSSSSNGSAGVTVGIVVALLLLLIIVVVLVLWRRGHAQTDIFRDEKRGVRNPAFGGKYEDTFRGMYMYSHQLTVLKDLGEGQFGSVVLAETSELPGQKLAATSRVAVKYLKRASDLDEQDLFMDEAARMQPLNHPHVVRLLAVSAPDSEEQFIVLEHLAGGDLINHLRDFRSTGLSQDIQLSYCRQVCAGLAYLGSVGYVHRDLAARNILMTGAQALKIGDFGMARSIHNSSYYTGKNAKARLPLRWMSPEAVLMNKYTHLSDVYALGVVMYEIFTYGDYPWAGFEDEQVIQELRKGTHMPLDNVPQRVQYLPLECWQHVDCRPTAKEVQMILSTRQLPVAEKVRSMVGDNVVVNEGYISGDMMIVNEMYGSIENNDEDV